LMAHILFLIVPVACEEKAMSNMYDGLIHEDEAGLPPGLAFSSPPGLQLFAPANWSVVSQYTEPPVYEGVGQLEQASSKSTISIAASFPGPLDQIHQSVLEEAETKLNELVAGTWSAMAAKIEQKRQEHDKHTSHLEEVIARCKSEIPRLEVQQLELKAQVARYSAALA